MPQNDFSVQVTEWVNKAKDKANAVFRGIAEEALGRVKELTPVKTGYLRANFVDVLNPIEIPSPTASPPVGLAISRAKIGDTIYIVNPVRYARRIEYGFVGRDSLGRLYNQKGRFMVTQTVAEMEAIATRVAERMARR